MRACASMPVLKSTPMIGSWPRDLRTRMPAPVPQHTSSPRPGQAERAQRVSGCVKHVITDAKRRAVELRS
jgi:hypothetical protein